MEQAGELDINQWRAGLEEALPGYLPGRRWFGGKARTIASVGVEEAIPLGGAFGGAYLALLRVAYAEGEPQSYVLPLARASGEGAAQVEMETPQAVVARSGDEILYDASLDRGFASALLEAIRAGKEFGEEGREVTAWSTQAFGRLYEQAGGSLGPSISKAEQSNTSVIYGRSFILKLFRRLEEGTSPDLEIGRFLGERDFRNTPPLAGAIEYRRGRGEPVTLAILQGFVPNRGDAWEYTLASLDGYFGQAGQAGGPPSPPRGERLLDLAEREPPANVAGAIGDYLEAARLLGRRTAEMHLALTSGASDPAFAPEPFTPEYQGEMYDSVMGLTSEAFRLLDPRQMAQLEEAQAGVGIIAVLQPLASGPIEAMRARCHGDYHLGQVLYTGDDFVIIDFEGEPVRSLAERRRKHSPLKDVAGMLRSFHYAAYSALFSRIEGTPGVDASRLEGWADNWHLWVSAAYLGEYLRVASQAAFLPHTRESLQTLLDIYLLEKAVYELIYEANNRPDWVRIPMQGVRQLVG